MAAKNQQRRIKTHTDSYLCYTYHVAVESDRTKPFTHASALGFYSRVSTGGSSKRFFYARLSSQPSGRVSFSLHRLYPRKTVPRFTPCVRPACLLGTG
jgi:hypothetical protein